MRTIEVMQSVLAAQVTPCSITQYGTRCQAQVGAAPSIHVDSVAIIPPCKSPCEWDICLVCCSLTSSVPVAVAKVGVRACKIVHWHAVAALAPS